MSNPRPPNDNYRLESEVKRMCIAYDPLKWADNYSSDFERMLEDKVLDLEAVKKLFDEGLITTEELEYAEDYFNDTKSHN